MKLTKSALAATLLAIVASGCATSEVQTATAPISQAMSSQIRPGVDTRTDIIAMFGAPNGLAQQSPYGAGMGYMPGAMMQAQMMQGQGTEVGTDNLLSYRDCTFKTAAEVDAAKTTAATAASVMTLGMSSWVFGGGMKNSMVEECKTLAVLLDDRNVVDAYGYQDSNLFDEARVAQVSEDQSTKADVIRAMAVPSSITMSGDSEVMTYKNCLTEGEAGFSVVKNTNKQRSTCQQASFIIDTNTDKVSRVTFIPFPVSK